MSVMCSICQDFLTERPQTQQPSTEDELKVISALRCGHMFHHVCVRQWFQTTVQRNQERPGANGDQAEGSCPCCKKGASLLTALRIYPTGDEDSNNVVQQKKNLEALTNENDKLTIELTETKKLLEQMETTELNEVKQLLGQMETYLEEEIVSHDMLKMEYGQVLSKMQEVQDQLNENLNIKTALENSVKTVVEKLEKEQAEALQKMAEMEVREKKLTEELATLKLGDKENVQTIFAKAQGSLFPQQTMQHNQRESILSINKGLGVMLISCDDQTSDGESPSSPPSCQSKQNLLPQGVPVPNFSVGDVDVSNSD